MANRLIVPTKWVDTPEIDAAMYLLQEKTSLQRWKVDRVAFMSTFFCIHINNVYRDFDKKSFKVDDLLLAYGHGQLPTQGKTNKVWDVDVDRIYVILNVNNNHWISMCISFQSRAIEVFDCGGEKRWKIDVDPFARLIPRIVKALKPVEEGKQMRITPYSVKYVLMQAGLNQNSCHCGVYALKFIECHALLMDFNLLHDDNIRAARFRIAVDLFLAANDPILVEMMKHYPPPHAFNDGIVVEIERDLGLHWTYGTGSVLGISFNMSEISELFLGERSFCGMHNLEFLRFYKQLFDKDRLHLHEGLDCLPLPRKLKLLQWEACPMKQMSYLFRPECLVEINMTRSKLKKLWDRVPMLRSLKKMDLSYSISLEELPDLSEAINLEHLNLQGCPSLLKLPSSVWKLRMLNLLDLHSCEKLEPLPANYALDSLTDLNIGYCLKFVDFPEISSKIEVLNVSYNPIRAVPLSIEDWNCLHTLQMTGCDYITEFPCVPLTLSELDLAATGIKEVPPWISDLFGLTKLTMAFCTELREISPNICELQNLRSLNLKGCYNVREFPAEIFQSFCAWFDLELTLIKIGENSLPINTPEKTEDFTLNLHMSENDFVSIPPSVIQQVQCLYLKDCRKLASLPELPESLSELYAHNCVSLERLSQSSRSPHDPKLILNFINCSKLNQEARELVIEQWTCGYAVLPGSEVPNYFTHQARGSSLTIHLNQRNLTGSLKFKACIVLPPGDELDDVPFFRFQISCHVRGRHSTNVYKWRDIYVNESDDYCLLENHLFIFNSYYTLEEDNIPENEMVFDFRCLGKKVYSDPRSSNILGCGVRLLEPCSCKFDQEAHPLLSTLPLEEEDEGNNNGIVETRRSNKRELSSFAEGSERASKNLKTSH